MIPKIDMLQQALASLRVTREPARADAAGATADGRRAAARPADPAPASRVALDEQIRRRAAGISQDDPHRRRRVLRVMLETCLSAEWGDDMAGDPAFQTLVDRVQQQIESDPSLQTIVDDALASLTLAPHPEAPLS